MNAAKTSAISGCVVWILSIGIITGCVLPLFIVIGSITSFSQFAIRTTGSVICPDGTTPESYSYETTSTDEFGNHHPATGVELRCVDQSGTVVKNDPVVYAFLWDGIFALIGLIISILLAFAFAAPIGILIGRWFNRSQKPTVSATMDPR